MESSFFVISKIMFVLSLLFACVSGYFWFHEHMKDVFHEKKRTIESSFSKSGNQKMSEKSTVLLKTGWMERNQYEE